MTETLKAANYSTDLLMKCYSDLIQEGVQQNKKKLMPLREVLDELEAMFPDFNRDDVEWSIFPDLVDNLYAVLKPALMNRN